MNEVLLNIPLALAGIAIVLLLIVMKHHARTDKREEIAAGVVALDFERSVEELELSA